MDRREFLQVGFLAASAASAGCLGGGSNREYADYVEDAKGDTTPVDRTGQARATVIVGAGDGFAFDPVVVEVSPGTTVVWEWSNDGNQHNVIHEGGAFASPYASEPGFTFEHAFEEPGVFRYYCKPHLSLGMKGVVWVRQG